MVKTATRTLDVFEAFATAKRPLTLSELARAIGAPVASCFGIVRTLERRGYLYSARPRRGLYPTRRLLDQARLIAAHDPLSSRLDSALAALRDRTGETVLLGKRLGDRAVYLDVREGPQTVRYTARVGDLKPLHSSAVGKALLGTLAEGDCRRLLDRLAEFRERTEEFLGTLPIDGHVGSHGHGLPGLIRTATALLSGRSSSRPAAGP